MPAHYATPLQLVEALQLGRRDAFPTLSQRLEQPLRRLLASLEARRGLRHDLNLVLRNILHSLAVYLRSRPRSEFVAVGWNAFQASLLVYAGKLALEPYATSARPGPVVPHGPSSGPGALPECPVYESATFFLPFEQLGANRFGGDWYAGRHTPDGSLWVIVADVTGHGYYAYLLAASLPYLWALCWDAPQTPEHPAELLRRLHEHLETALPEGVYVEATLARLRSDGEVLIAPGGGSRLLVRDATGRVVQHALRGGWLGFMPPASTDQKAWALSEGEEVLLASDGLFDQMEAAHAALDWASVAVNSDGLFNAVRRLLEQALRRHPQKDDITAILLRRRPGVRS